MAARTQVARYLRALGLPDGEHLRYLVERVLAQTRTGSEQEALAVARQMTARFLDAVDSGGSAPGSHWLTLFLRTHGESFPDHPAAAARFAAGLDEWDGQIYHGFRPQHLSRVVVPRWLKITAGPVVAALAVPAVAVAALGSTAQPALLALWAVVVGFLTFVVGCGLTAAVIGFLTDPGPGRAPARHGAIAEPGAPGRVAVVVPVYQEDAVRVFGMLVALWEGLRDRPDGAGYEFFVLSDTRNPDLVRAELRTLSWVRHRGAPGMPLSYRRRAGNQHKKAGNLADFLGSVGHRYDYAVVLDADSVMRPSTVAEMVARMRSDPQLGLLQAPLELHRATTLFARAQQFTSATVGPMAARGLAEWADPDGNYYGHNAVVRVRAFLDSCALPDLAGRPPLGGQLLSHDFVEAALLCRSGWRVTMAHDLDGSWEECPPTLEQFVARDRRWSQGNLQHLRILGAAGLRPMSRLHMFLGAASYLASPALLLFTGLGLVMAALDGSGTTGQVGLALTVGAAIALLVPRTLAWLSIVRVTSRADRFGGRGPFTVGMLLDAALALVLGPVMMLHHSAAVLSILAGRSSGWGPQLRDGGVQSRRQTARAQAWPTALGAGAAAALATWAPGALWWLAPLWLPMALAVPLTMLAASEKVGSALRRAGLLTVPVERRPEPVTRRMDVLTAAMHENLAEHELHDIVLDPMLLEEHCRLLERGAAGLSAAARVAVPDRPEIDRDELAGIRLLAALAGPAVLQAHERTSLLTDPAALRWLHEHAWPVWSRQLDLGPATPSSDDPAVVAGGRVLETPAGQVGDALGGSPARSGSRHTVRGRFRRSPVALPT